MSKCSKKSAAVTIFLRDFFKVTARRVSSRAQKSRRFFCSKNIERMQKCPTKKIKKKTKNADFFKKPYGVG
jgi:hypothetical protein